MGHPQLLQVDPESIRKFLCLCEQYKREVESRAQELTASKITTETVTPVNFKFCVDPEITEWVLGLLFIPDFTDYDRLTDKLLKAYLKEKEQESKDSVTLGTLDGMVRTYLRMEMSDKNAKSHIEDWFISYYRILGTNSLSQ